MQYSTKAISMALLFALTTACTTTPKPIPPAKEATAMTAPVSAPMTANPKLSAEEIGKRFLKLFEGLESRNELSLEHIKEVTGITLSYVQKGGHYAYSEALRDGWYYMLWYIPESDSLKNGVSLMFSKPTEEFGDMSPICSLDFDYYNTALKAMGFLAEPHYGEIGELRSWRYTKFKKSDGTVDMTISIIPQNVVAGEEGRLCVKSIGTLN